MRKVIVNSTPLISLCRVGLFDLLRKRYEEITIPEAVFREVTSKELGYIEAVMPIIREMESKGIYFSKDLIAQVMRASKEES